MPIATSGTICARAARLQAPILVPDVTADEDWTPYLSFSEAAGTAKELNFVRVSCAFASDAIAELRWREPHQAESVQF